MGVVGAAAAAAGGNSTGRFGPGTNGFKLAGIPGGQFLSHQSTAIEWKLQTSQRHAVREWLIDARQRLNINESSSSNNSTLSLDGDVLDVACVSLVSTLLPNLVHDDLTLRSECMYRLLELGTILSQEGQEEDDSNGNASEIRKQEASNSGERGRRENILDKETRKIGGVDSPLANDDESLTDADKKRAARDQRHRSIVDRTLQETDFFASLELFFRLMGPTLSPMVLALVDRLESNYLHPHTIVRDASIVISAQLMLLHPTLFISSDKLVSVWNLFFLLDLLGGGGSSSSGLHHLSPLNDMSDGSRSLARFDGGSITASSTRNSSMNHLSLASLVSSMPLSGTRLSIILSLGTLVQLYVPHHVRLTHSILSRLLKLPEKSAKELRAIQTAVLAIGNACLAHVRTLPPSSSSSPSSSTSSVSDYSLYPTFLSLLSAHDEEHLDLLAWSTFAYTFNLQASVWNDAFRASSNVELDTKGNTTKSIHSSNVLKKPSSSSATPVVDSQLQPRRLLVTIEQVDALFYETNPTHTKGDNNNNNNTPVDPTLPSLSHAYPNDFFSLSRTNIVLPLELSEHLSGLSNHFQAPPTLIRYGASIAFGSILRIYPTILIWEPETWTQVLWGILDQHSLTRTVYLGILKRVACGIEQVRLQTMIRQYEFQLTVGPTSSTTALPPSAASSSSASPPSAVFSIGAVIPTLDDILREALTFSNKISIQFMLHILTTFVHESLQVQVRQLKLIQSCIQRINFEEEITVSGSGGGGGVVGSNKDSNRQQTSSSSSSSSSSPSKNSNLILFGQKLLPFLSSSSSSSYSSELSLLTLDIFRQVSRRSLLTQMGDQVLLSIADFIETTIERDTNYNLAGGGGGGGGGTMSLDDSSSPSSSTVDQTSPSTTDIGNGFEAYDIEHRLMVILEILPDLPWLTTTTTTTVVGSESNQPYPLQGSSQRLDRILTLFSTRLLLHPSTNLRSSCFTMLQRASELWSNKSLLSKAASLALVGLGDIQSSNVSIAWTTLVHLVQVMNIRYGDEKDSREDRLLEILHQYRTTFSSTSLLKRLHAYDHLARSFMLFSGEQAQIALFSMREMVMGGEFKEFVIRLVRDTHMHTHIGGAREPS